MLTARRAPQLRGSILVPGDKSMSHRALILGAMADGETTIEGLGESDDVLATVRALELFGVKPQRLGEAQWRVWGQPWRSPAVPIDCANSGTTARLLMGAVAGMRGVEATFIGDRSLSRRPMRRLVVPLRRMGAIIDDGDTLPITVAGAPLGGLDHCNVPASAQVKTALLLAGLSTSSPVRIAEPIPSRDHGEILLERFGVDVETSAKGTVALGSRRKLIATTVEIGGDPSSAGFPLVAAALSEGSEVTVRRMMVNPRRTGLYEVLERMGADIELANERRLCGEIIADMTIRGSWLQTCRVEASDIPAMVDEIPLLAMACAACDGESVIAGLAELRHKESDRLGALVAGLAACGVAASVDGDNLHIFGRGRARGGRVASHGDHRIAMAFLTLGLASREGVTVDGEEMISTSFPGYVDTMRALGADIR